MSYVYVQIVPDLEFDPKEVTCPHGTMITEILRVVLREEYPKQKKATMSMVEWLCDFALKDPQLVKERDGLFRAFDIRQEIQRHRDEWEGCHARKAEVFYKIKKADYDFVDKAIASPSNGYFPSLSFQIMEFQYAWKNALSEADYEKRLKEKAEKQNGADAKAPAEVASA